MIFENKGTILCNKLTEEQKRSIVFRQSKPKSCILIINLDTYNKSYQSKPLLKWVK